MKNKPAKLYDNAEDTSVLLCALYMLLAQHASATNCEPASGRSVTSWVNTCCMMTGEAAGTAAALLRGTNLAARDIDIDLLRTTLKQNNAKSAQAKKNRLVRTTTQFRTASKKHIVSIQDIVNRKAEEQHAEE